MTKYDNCNIDISSKNYDRHFKTGKRLWNEELNFNETYKLQKWAKENNIYSYKNSSKTKLKDITGNLMIWMKIIICLMMKC